ncbi:MAG: TldD/PmbA family protein [Planctomycetes bacterium]|nr:TldD/PmbA family protein [Planctomycetota bacterium]
MSNDFIDRDSFRRIADTAIEASSGDHTIVTLNDRAGATTRIANNQIVQNVNTRRSGISVSVAFGSRHGAASSTDVSEESITDAVRRAERIAKVSPEDPEYLPPLPAQRYPVLPTYRAVTAGATPGRLAAEARTAIELCTAEHLTAAGIVSAYTDAVGVAADTGLFAYEQRSRAQFSLTATGEDSSGWVNNANRSIDDLRVAGLTRVAIDKARRSAKPREFPPGRYTAILEPACVDGLLGSIFFMLDAKSYHAGTSSFNGKLGERIFDPRLTLQNRPDHPALLGNRFDAGGLPSDSRAWIERGVLKRLNYDRFTAKQQGTEPTYRPDALHFSGTEPAGDSVDDLVRTTERGILVTNFWYIRTVNPTDLTLTGMTRDGTFLIEDGRITTGLINFRWHDSPLRVFDNVEAFTTPMDAITLERPKMLVPAMKVLDFNFSSVTRF